jgi:gliding motility-associated-like protein
LASDVTVECDGNGNAADLQSWLASNGGASSTDACSSVTWTNDYSALSGDCGASGSVLVTFTATDDCGNSSTSSATFTIQDTTAPTFSSSLPADMSVECDEIPIAATVLATDTCSSSTTVTLNEEIISEGESCAGEYTLIRTWTATDSCGNETSYSQTISIYDITPPVLVTPIDTELTVACSEIPEIPQLELSDNCSNVADIVYNETTTTISIYEYIIIREWTFYDDCGNNDTITQTINVTVSQPFDAIPYNICTEEKPIDLFSILGESIPTNGEWIEVTNSGGLSGSYFDPTNVTVGYYTLQYIVDLEDNDCPIVYEIYMHVHDDCVILPACSVKVYNAVSPNNDGYNDVFFIDGLTCYPDNSVQIYNRWGILVYDASGYDNQMIAFKGYSEGRGTFNKNELLPDGTYFYIIKYRDEQNQTIDLSGYLYLTR